MADCEGDFDIGDVIVWVATFTNGAGVLTTPGAVTFEVEEPDGTELPAVSTPSAQITNPSVGVMEYTMATPVDQAGTWWCRVTATAGLLASATISRTVARSVFA